MSRNAKGQFPKGRSGNPGGRPKKVQVTSSASQELLDKRFNVEIGGVERELTAEEVLELTTIKLALAGNRRAMHEVYRMIKKYQAYSAPENGRPQNVPSVKIRFSRDPENVDQALVLLGIASMQPHFEFECGSSRKTLKMETWAAQAAMSRPNAPDLDEDDRALFAGVVRNSKQVRLK